jgi:hypothetical protein
MNSTRYAVILIALVAGACGGATVSPTGLASSGATVSPTGVASRAPITTTTPSPAPTASPPSLLEGTWTTAEITCDELLATMHDAGFTDAQITAGNWACSQPLQWRLRFLGVSFAQFGRQVDGVWELGSGRSFRLIDDHTLFLTDGEQTLGFTLVGDVLTFVSIRGSTGDLDGQVHGAAIFLTAPFTKDQ